MLLGVGVMIFISVGTTSFGFPRLIDQAIAYGTRCPEIKFVIQSGPYIPTVTIPKNIILRPYYSYEEMGSLMHSAQAVACHGGFGTIYGSLQKHKIPWVLPRLSRLGEHVSDHQVDLVNYLLKRNVVKLIKNSDSWNIMGLKKLSVGAPVFESIEENKKTLLQKISTYYG